MENLESSLSILNLIGSVTALVVIILRVGRFTAEIDNKIAKIEGALLARIADLRSEMLLAVKDIQNNQNIDDYKFIDHSRQLSELHTHIRDMERTLEKTQGYARRPYQNFEETQGRRVPRSPPPE